MNWIWWILCRLVYLILDKVVFRNHFNVRVICIDMDRTPEGDGYRSVAGEQSPPYAFPQSFVGFAKLRTLNAARL